MTDFQYPDDIYTEAEPDVNTLVNLGPLAPMAGIWEGKRGLDINPKAEGPEILISNITSCNRLMHKLMAHNCITACVITRGLCSLMRWKPFTIKWAIGYGNRQPARFLCR